MAFEYTGTKLSAEQVKELCSRGILTSDSILKFDEDKFAPVSFAKKDNQDENKSDYYLISKKLDEYINSLINDKIAQERERAPREIQGEIETIFRYKALSLSDKIHELKELHKREWDLLQTRLSNSNWQMAYLGDDDFFIQAFRMALSEKMDEFLFWTFYQEEKETIFGAYKEDWFSLIHEEVLPDVRLFHSLQVLEFIKKQIDICTEPVKDNNQNTNSEKQLSLKQQILLLDAVDFFSLSKFDALNIEQKGIFLGHLFGRHHQNAKDAMRYRQTPKNMVPKDDNFVMTERNINKVDSILKEVGLKK